MVFWWFTPSTGLCIYQKVLAGELFATSCAMILLLYWRWQYGHSGSEYSTINTWGDFTQPKVCPTFMRWISLFVRVNHTLVSSAASVIEVLFIALTSTKNTKKIRNDVIFINKYKKESRCIIGKIMIITIKNHCSFL